MQCLLPNCHHCNFPTRVSLTWFKPASETHHSTDSYLWQVTCSGGICNQWYEVRNRAVSRYSNLTYQCREVTTAIISQLFEPNKPLLLYEIYYLYFGNYVSNNLNTLPRQSVNGMPNPCHTPHTDMANSMDCPVTSIALPNTGATESKFLTSSHSQLYKLRLAVLHITILSTHRACTGFFYP